MARRFFGAFLLGRDLLRLLPVERSSIARRVVVAPLLRGDLPRGCTGGRVSTSGRALSFLRTSFIHSGVLSTLRQNWIKYLVYPPPVVFRDGLDAIRRGS